NGNTIANLIDGVDNNVYVVSAPSGTLNGAWFNFEFPAPKALTYLEIGHYQSQTLFSTTSTYKVQGSADNTNWTDVTGTLTYSNTATSTTLGLSNFNSNIANFPTNKTEYKYYRILGIAATSGGGWATEIYFKESICADIDTDGDGTPNHLDTDSDGDGCSDAYEAGATSSITAGYTFAGPYGANGLENSLETTTESGVVNYNLTYGNAINASISNCKDTDVDGIPDIIDIDDDNDGVLDSAERCGTSTQSLTNGLLSDGVLSNGVSTTTVWPTNNVSGGLYPNTAIYNSATTELSGTSGINIMPGADGSATLTISAGNVGLVSTPNNEVTDAFVAVFEFNASSANASITYTNVFDHSGRQLLTLSDIEFFSIGYGYGPTIMQSNIVTITNPTPGTFVVTKNGSQDAVFYRFRSKTGGLLAKFDATSSGLTFNDEFVHSLSRVIQCNLDTDNDGTPNHLDLDSDGDGCSDAIESSSSTTATSTSVFPTGTDTNTNGLLNVYEGTTAGTINYTSTYSTALNNAIVKQSTIETGKDQSVCVNTALTPITLTTTLASNATVTGLPAGLTSEWSNNVLTIFGTPTVTGAFTYTATTTGGCSPASTTGVITVVVLSPDAGADFTKTCTINPAGLAIGATAVAGVTYAWTPATGLSDA
ncbi:MAG: discoidin domain-containing protein, partial [Dolichospermum sp.]